MKQLLQNISTGKAIVAEVPAPKLDRGQILVQVAASLISAGTERMVVEFAEKNLVQKAMARPDLVREVIEKVRREGVLSTMEAVRRRLDSDLPLGYSNAGIVLAVAEDITEFKVGDRVACAGGSYASHAEIVRVPRNLVAKIPDAEITFEEAAFATVGAIALHGFRLAQAQLGETVAVIGLGLIGLITVQLVKAAGCIVVGMDIDPQRCRLAHDLGCDDTAANREEMQTKVAAQTASMGADVVLITAATTSSDPIHLGAEIARDRARVVAVGAVGLEIPRKPYYEKELSFLVSRSYGPGRYDAEYEEKSHDYPIGYVRWTEGRNVQSVVQLLARGKLNVRKLITHRFEIEHADKAYELISGKTAEPFLGIILTFPNHPSLARRIDLCPPPQCAPTVGNVGVGLIGAGNFASATLVPAMKQVPGIDLIGVCAATGASAHGVGARLGFRYCTTDERELLSDPAVNTIVIATRHSLHARQVLGALSAGKHVFCEKPLCLNEVELGEIVQAYDAARSNASAPFLMVGFNRRFAPLAVELERFIRTLGEPLVMNYRVNAGYLPFTHWTQDPEQGGGRIIGEVCHFVDFLIFLANAPVVSVRAAAMDNFGRYRDDNVAATLEFANGSVGTITYVANGDRSLSKERAEIFCGGGAAILDDYRSLEMLYKGRKRVSRARLHQDKGHRAEVQAFATALRCGGSAPINFDQIVNATLSTFKIVEAIRSGQSQTVPSTTQLVQS